MIRQNDERDNFAQVKYGSVISYPAGVKHLYRDFLVLGKTKTALTTVPLQVIDQTAPNDYDVSLPPSLNETLGADYVVSPLNAAILDQNTYHRINSVHLFDLAPNEVKAVDRKSGQKIALARKQFANWQKIEHSDLPITKKHQALRAGLASKQIITANGLQPYLLAQHLTGTTTNKTDHAASYIDQTYAGSLYDGTVETMKHLPAKYADVDRLKKYDIIRYKAITGSFAKWRPFMVTGQNGQSVDLIPITHTLRGNLDGSKGHGLYSIYHLNIPANIAQAISLMNGDSREKAKTAQTALVPCNELTVNLTEFKQKQLPQYLGSLKDYVPLTDLAKLEDAKNDTIETLMTSYDNYLTEKRAFGHIKHYQLKLVNRKCISTKDLKALVRREGTGKYAHKTNLAPVIDPEYLAQKEAHNLTYGVYQTVHRPTATATESTDKQIPDQALTKKQQTMVTEMEL